MAAGLMAGCGGDDNSTSKPTPAGTTETIPTVSTTPSAEDPGTATQRGGDDGPADPGSASPAPGEGDGSGGSGGGGTGGTPAPGSGSGSGGTPAPGSTDSPDSDSPAPPGSPAERYEQYCDENPGACG